MQQYSLTLPRWLFFLLVVYCLSITVFLIGRIFYSVPRKESAKYGFLNKPIMQLVIFSLMIGSIFGGMYAVQNAQNIYIDAEKQVELNIRYRLVSETPTKKKIQFSAVPVVDGKEWANEEFDFIWTISSSEESKNYYEESRSVDSPSRLEINLEKALYKINLLAVGEESAYEESITLDFR